MSRVHKDKGSSGSGDLESQHPLADYQPDGVNAGHSGYVGAKQEVSKRMAHLEAQLTKRFNDANERLKQDATRVSIVRNGKASLALQFSAPEKRYKVGCDCGWSAEGIALAEQKARKVANKLLHKEWSKEWYDRDILGKVEAVEVEAEKPPKTIGELVADFKAHYDATHEPGERAKKSWDTHYLSLLKKFPDWLKPLSQNELKSAIEATKSNTRTRKQAIWMFSKFLEFAGELDAYKAFLGLYKDSTKYEVKERDIPADEYIEGAIQSLQPLKSCAKKFWGGVKSLQWSFGMLATYGLRCHETINILNLFEPSIYKGETIYPYNDRVNNPQAIIHIGGSTKTGERLAMPLSPLGKDWLTQFDLLNPKQPKTTQIPTMQEERQQYGRITKALKTRTKQLDTHAYRHAYNHRSRELGIDVAVVAKSMGHSIRMNSSTYERHMKGEREVKQLVRGFDQAKNNQKPHLTLEQAMSQASLLAGDDPAVNEALSKLLATIYGLPVPTASEAVTTQN